MSTKRSKAAAKPQTPDLTTVAKSWSEQKNLSGSSSGYFTLLLVSQVYNAQFHGKEAPAWIVELSQQAGRDALAGLAPRDPHEGMLAAQMVATHTVAMDCFRRAQLPEQTFEGRQMALTQANKLVRSYAALAEALDRHRGKGQPQVVRVERVTVEAGGQAIVGAVRQGGGDEREPDEQPHAKQLAHAPESQMWCANPERRPVPVARGEGKAAL